jgi:hypothetical protein
MQVALIEQALSAAGYDCEPTPDNLIDCWLDYAAAYGGNVEELRNEIAEGLYSINGMCRGLIRGVKQSNDTTVLKAI